MNENDTSTATPAPRRIGPYRVHPIGLGCMNLSHAYGAPPPVADAERLLLQALDLGVTLFDTAALYGFGANETLVGRVLKPHRSRIVLCSKGGMAGEPVGEGGALQRVIDGRPATLRRHCEASLQRLGTDVIDLYYLHRWDKQVPIEDSMGALADLVRAGKIRHVGLSEVSAATLRRAHAVHTVAALQSEYSPWSRNAEYGTLAACRALGVAYVAFSPVARGWFASQPPEPEGFDAKDIRRGMPRFQPAHWSANLALLRQVQSLAAEAGCSPAQLALAWLLAQSDAIVPIPGTTNPAHLAENVGAASLHLAPALLQRLSDLVHDGSVSGHRYGAQARAEVDTEEMPAAVA